MMYLYLRGAKTKPFCMADKALWRPLLLQLWVNVVVISTLHP